MSQVSQILSDISYHQSLLDGANQNVNFQEADRALNVHRRKLAQAQADLIIANGLIAKLPESVS